MEAKSEGKTFSSLETDSLNILEFAALAKTKKVYSRLFLMIRPSFIHSFYFAFNKKYNNSIQKYIKDNIQYSN